MDGHIWSKLSWRLLAIFGTLAMALMGTPTTADAPVAQNTIIKPQLLMDVPIIDGDLVIGTLSVQSTVILAASQDEVRFDERRGTIRELQLLQLAEFARLRAHPERPVNAKRVAVAMEEALHLAGFRTARILVTSVRATED
ncbi:hypothetical protein [Sandaracinobacteroides saxicola]|uniref:Uncharacterized protein n=1 Tax=Sandaracinobacteroides saxicola TaxID=2759707 RepID=A0A7G5IK22_9SPHN|nr:hypothetical protein [Sandaracinobacteroides saxicola]QMW23714.1 hypothetical protein H3309_04290 [Sandaracinobacteroides saxicola]